jgi:hypothetical protein
MLRDERLHHRVQALAEWDNARLEELRPPNVDQRLRNIDVFDLETPSFPSTQSGTVQEQQ